MSKMNENAVPASVLCNEFKLVCLKPRTMQLKRSQSQVFRCIACQKSMKNHRSISLYSLPEEHEKTTASSLHLHRSTLNLRSDCESFHIFHCIFLAWPWTGSIIVQKVYKTTVGIVHAECQHNNNSRWVILN